jgi:hypothetical protein
MVQHLPGGLEAIMVIWYGVGLKGWELGDGLWYGCAGTEAMDSYIKILRRQM